MATTKAYEIGQLGSKLTVDSDGDIALNTINSLLVDVNTLTVDPTNNRVGIGTTAPAAKLHLDTASAGMPKIRFTHTNAGGDNFEIGTGVDGVSNGGWSIRDIDASANRFVINSSGNVGIGTNSPDTSSKLHTYTTNTTARTITETSQSGGYSGYRMTNGTGYWEMQVDGSNQSLRFLDDGTERLDISSTSQVTVYGHIKPSTTLAYDLGDSDNRFRDIYLSGSTINLAGTKLSVDSSGDLELKDLSNNFKKIRAKEVEFDDASDSDHKTVLKRDNSGRMSFVKVRRSDGAELTDSADKVKLDFDNMTTADLTEHTKNKYFTDARARGSVSTSNVSGHGTLGYNSSTGVISYTGISTSTIRGLISVTGDLSYNSSTGVISTNGLASSTTADLSEDSSNLYFTNARADARADARIAAASTSDLSEGTNLYFTNARADARIAAASTADLSEDSSNLYYTNARADARIAAASTSDLSEGTNLYYTQARFNSAFTAKSTSDLSEGTNLYFTNARADARIAAASTSDLSEGTNLYYTDARADARAQLKIDALVGSAPGTLDTLQELGDALGDDPNFATTVTNSIATKLALSGGTITGNLEINTGTNKNIDIKALSHQTESNMGVGLTFSRTTSDAPLMAIGVIQQDNLALMSRSGLNFLVGGTNNYEYTSQAMGITSDGDVGIGTGSPNGILEISQDNSRLILSASNSNLSAQHRIEFWETASSSTVANAQFAIEYDGTTSYGGDGALLFRGYASAPLSTANYVFGGISRTGTTFFMNKLGIGTSSPAKQLEVTGDIQLDGTNANLWIKSGAAGTNGFINWTFNTEGTVYNKVGMDYDTRATTGFHIDAGYPITIDATASGGKAINFAVGGSTKAIVNGSGNVGIGTTSPNQKLTVNTPNRTDGGTNSLGAAVIAGPISVPDHDFTNSTAIFRVQGTDATNNIQFGVGNSSYSYHGWIQASYDNTSSYGSKDLLLQPIGGNVGIGTTSPAEKLDVAGNIKHTGLTMTSGTDVDQLYTVTKSITLSTSWQTTGIDGSDLSTGSYMVQLYVNDQAVGGGQYEVYYTGVMSWFSANTNDDETDEIVLHRAGHAPNAGAVYLKTVHTYTADTDDLELHIRGTQANTGASNYQFKFRRLI